jgi:hypothetical protein
MKLKISTVIDVPDEVLIPGEYRLASAIQLVFDEVTNYVTCRHLSDTVKWCAKAKAGSDKENKKSTEYQIYKHHQWWGETCSKLNWDYEEVLEPKFRITKTPAVKFPDTMIEKDYTIEELKQVPGFFRDGSCIMDVTPEKLLKLEIGGLLHFGCGLLERVS